MSYEKLLDDLETLQKSYAAADEDDKAIQAAAAEGDEDDEKKLDADGNPIVKADADEGDDKGDDKPFAKSFTGTTADGEPFEAIDGTEMLKSLNDRIDGIAAGAESEKADLTKSLTFLIDVIKSQGALIKSLQTNVNALANSGSGRKSVLTPTVDMAKSLIDSAPLNAGSFMLKANAAFDAGRITGKDLTVCDVAMRYGTDIDPAILEKVMVG